MGCCSCYNTVEAGKAGLTPPTSWKDLTDPQYAGHLIMPNPNSSAQDFLTSLVGFNCLVKKVDGSIWTPFTKI